MRLKVLPSNIANLIAAGEVVQRPASVVKELMENAVDAGADKINVIIKDAGRTLIQIIDNGCGMSPDDAVLCFERHATSKIAEAIDLNNIRTLGFRGEALASIAAVAEVTLKTRRAEDSIGCQVDMAASKNISTEEVACPVGSNFAVRNLFYNVPARRKFLKSDTAEFKHIVEEFTRVALSRPEISFTLTHNDKDYFVLRPAKSLKFRIQDLLGTSAVDKVVDISADTDAVKIRGYVCSPDLARKTVGNQYFFINGRFFRSPYFHKAVMKAYEGFIADGMVPSYFILMEADPSNIDVNIHPAKTEVKFEDDSVVFQVLFACVKEALGRTAYGSEIDFDEAQAPQIPIFGQKYDDYRPFVDAPNPGIDPDYNPFESAGLPTGAPQQEFPSFGGKQYDYPAGQPSYDNPPAGSYSKYVDRREDYGKLFEDKTIPTTSVIILAGKYIVTQVKSGLLVVNITRARERILYEKFLNVLTKGTHISQQTLFPVQVVVGVENRLVFDEHKDLLESLGFDIAPFGNDTIVVNGVPEGFSCEQSKVEALMADVLIALTEDHSSLPGMMESSMAGKFAAIGARGGKNMTSPVEAQRLIDSLFGCENSEYTPKGHKTMTIIATDEVDKKF